MKKTKVDLPPQEDKVGAFPAFPPCYGGMTLAADNAGFFATGKTYTEMAVCVPFTSQSIWGEIMSYPAALLPWNPVSEESNLEFPASYELPAEPYDTGSCIFRPWYTGIYQIAVKTVLYASFADVVVGHTFDVHWGLVKGEIDTIKLIADISALDTTQLLPLAHHANLSDSAIPIELHTSQILKIGRNEEVALFAYFTSTDLTTPEIMDVLVMNSPGFSASPAFIQFNRVG